VRLGRIRRAPATAARYLPALLGGVRRPDQRFVILCVGRCGSELLVELLDAQPGVHCASEILTKGPRWPYHLARAHAVRAQAPGTKAFGFKVLVNSLRVNGIDTRALMARFVADDWLLIGLTRRNVLRQSVSWLRADEQQRWHQRERLDTPLPPIDVNPEDLLTMMVLQDRENQTIASIVGAAPRGVLLTYEDDLRLPQSHQPTVDSIMSRLGLPASPVAASLVPTTPERLEDEVANFDAVTRLVANSRFANLLDAP
jgi:hypothetical protein